jgi:exonuclease VII large subunit
MNENQLLRISFVGTITGLIFLYFIVSQVAYDHVKIDEITGNTIGRMIETEGIVSGLYFHKNGHVFFDLAAGDDKVRTVIWENIVDELSLKGVDFSKMKNGVKLSIKGSVELYKGELEIIAKSIKFI